MKRTLTRQMFRIVLIPQLIGLLLICAACATADAPASVFLQVEGSGAVVTDANGGVLRCRDGTFSGTMSLLQQTYLAPGSTEAATYLAEAPYSERFTCEAESGARQGFSMAFYSGDQRREYAVSGPGLERIEIDCRGQITCQGEDMELAVFATLPCDALGEKGCVRLYTRASGRAEFSVQGEQLHYEGVDPASAYISYAGTRSAPYVPLDGASESGTLDFRKIAGG